MSGQSVAELRAAGYEGLRFTCPGCKWIAILWWGLLRARPEETVRDLCRRISCENCGAAPTAPSIESYRHSDHTPKSMG